LSLADRNEVSSGNEQEAGGPRKQARALAEHEVIPINHMVVATERLAKSNQEAAGLRGVPARSPDGR
jgi:hypothetical protein